MKVKPPADRMQVDGAANPISGLLHNVLLFFTLSFGVIAPLWAQGTAYVTGYVRDATGAAVIGAAVTVLNENTGARYALRTTEEGVFRSPAILPGEYEITVAAQGFQEYMSKGVAVILGQSRDLDIVLQVGAVNQTVEVQAAAPLLKTEDPGLGQNIEYKQVSTLPYFNRSAGVLLSLAPTVRYTGEDVISYGASRYNVGGFTNVNVMVDGASVNGDRTDVAQMVYNPSVEALQEVKVSTSQYSAEFGKDVGGLVQMQAKSGTNAYHGGTYYYFRNEALDAMNAFSRTTPVDRQHMFGGTLGGPIKKNKLLFFSTLEVQRSIAPLGVALTVPTAGHEEGRLQRSSAADIQSRQHSHGPSHEPSLARPISWKYHSVEHVRFVRSAGVKVHSRPVHRGAQR